MQKQTADKTKSEYEPRMAAITTIKEEVLLILKKMNLDSSFYDEEKKLQRVY